MLRKHSQFWRNILITLDIITIAFAWVTAYVIRFSGIAIPVYSPDIPPFQEYLKLLLPIVIVCPFIFKNIGLYKPRRITSLFAEFFDIAKASTLAVIILIAATFLVRKYDFSRLVFSYFWLISIVMLSIERALFREFLRFLRRKGYNMRHVLIVGAGELGKRVVAKIKNNTWTGLNIVGYLDDYKQTGELVEGKKILGRISDVHDIVRAQEIDQIFVALPMRAYRRIMYVIERLSDELVTIRIVPDIYQTVTLNASVEDFDGLPLINLTDTHLYGWNVVAKRFVDMACSLIALVITAPLMAFIALIIKLTSPGSVLYKQERMGLDGKTFNMLKFRSMREDAEVETGAVWAKESDPRRTAFGVFLRKTSLDELPQFFNVLKGNMSIVGPRPERPVFIEQFKKNIPGYMLRHKMKAGITGWAQVNGWRGDTDLKKRIEYDLYYIENWSLLLDIKIMWLTVWKGLISKNAY